MKHTTILALAACLSLPAHGEQIRLSELDLSRATSAWGPVKTNLSFAGNTISIGGVAFSHGVGVHAPSRINIDLAEHASRFTAFVGQDDARDNGSVEFKIFTDGNLAWRSGVMKSDEQAKRVDLDVSGVRLILLETTIGGDNGSGDHADWADATIVYKDTKPGTAHPWIISPPPPDTPRITGASSFGVRPKHPALFRVTASGAKPMEFSASGLPAGLEIDPQTGVITGRLDQAGRHAVTVNVKSPLGAVSRILEIVAGETIALAPPMGWNSWNCWGSAVDADKVMRSAKAMVKSGLDAHGWLYINVDDAWQNGRAGQFNAIQGNEKFPDMKTLCDDIHALGLKAGIYSSPWTTTYAGHLGTGADAPDGSVNEKRNAFGAYVLEKEDAAQWAAWGFDYLKYDWWPNDVPHAESMQKALRACGRDIVFSLSNNSSYDQAREWARIANCWRTTGDIVDTWDSICFIWDQQNKWGSVAGPGHWNDPDMLVVGKVGWGPDLRDTRLTPDEQYSHISLWCLLSAPLLLGCDLEQLDEFTLSILTNNDVLDVNQDPIGEPAFQVTSKDGREVWVKRLADGSRAVGLFNRTDKEVEVTVRWWEDIGTRGTYTVRDLWRQRDIGKFSEQYTSLVAPHGVRLLKLASAETK